MRSGRVWIERSSAAPAVLSLNVQAAMAGPTRVPGQFEVLVRHLFDRMLNNEAFGEDAAARATQLIYAIGLPGALVALFLFPAYHQPAIENVRTYWAQAADHLFYITYSLVIMGIAVVFQWELLFPDLLDMYVLSSLPVQGGRLLLGRAAALGWFLGLVLVGTSALGALFFPGSADLPCGFWRHLAAHALAVGMGGVAAALALVTLQALIGCVPARALSSTLSAAARSGAVLVLLTILFLFPLTAHVLPQVLGSGGVAVRLFPPFWFLGVYECALWGGRALPVFHALAWTAFAATAALAMAAAVLYPPAHALRLRRLIEGTGLRKEGSPVLGRVWRRGLHAVLLRTPGERAIFHFAAQTLLRLSRLQLYLAMYAGLGLALLLSGLLTFAVEGGRVRLRLAESGVRMAVPVLAFWTVAGLRTALASPLGRQGSWIFRIARANSRAEELHGAELLVSVAAMAVTLAAVAVLCAIAPETVGEAKALATQVMLACGLSLLLTDLFFLGARALPFTAARLPATRELPLTLVRYFVVFPAFALWVAEQEPWIESSWRRLGLTGAMLVAMHLGLRLLRRAVLQREEPREELIFTGLGLRD